MYDKPFQVLSCNKFIKSLPMLVLTVSVNWLHSSLTFQTTPSDLGYPVHVNTSARLAFQPKLYGYINSSSSSLSRSNA